MNKEELSEHYANQKVLANPRNVYNKLPLGMEKSETNFDGYDIEQAYEDGFDKAVELTCAFLKDRIEHDSIDYPMATMYLINDLKRYVKGIEL